MGGLDIKNIDASADPTPREDAAPDTKNLDPLLASLNGSAERFQTLWFSFLGLTLYLAITALATTHRMLLLGEPQTLPLLNIKVELLPFYIIAPLLYLVFHFYLLMMLALLARTAAEFDKQLRTTLPDDAQQERYRARVENALFLQLLVGMKGERKGFNAFLLGLIALITIVLAPLVTLILMQMMFLPYHHLRITWWHRVLVMVDFGLILVMWGRYWDGFERSPFAAAPVSASLRTVFAGSAVERVLTPFRDWARFRGLPSPFAILIVALPVFWLSFWEGRWAGEPLIGASLAGTKHNVVFGLFPNRLVLFNEIVVGDELLEKTKREMASRGGEFAPTIKLDERDLQAANLSGADLRGVDLRDATMRGAVLMLARLDGARLDEADLGGGELLYAQLQGAYLSSAKLQGTNLRHAHLQGAHLRRAQLQSGDLSNANLQGADLSNAQLQGADLSEAQLQGADLSNAQLQGADLSEAQLQGADLGYALLYGASLEGAELQGASLKNEELQGADLRRAQLQGVDLGGAGLQGADLSQADLADSEFDGAFVFRTNIAAANLPAAGVRSVHTDEVMAGEKSVFPPERLTPADVEAWIAAATEFADGGEKARIIRRFARLKPIQPTEEDASDEAKWAELAKQSLALDPDGAQHRRRLADRLGDLACAGEGAPYVARGLVRKSVVFNSGRLAALGKSFGSIRARMEESRKNPGHDSLLGRLKKWLVGAHTCPGVDGFTEDDWRQLEAIKPTGAAPANH